MKTQDGDILAHLPRVRTFEIVQYVTGYVECEKMEDLPNNIQDRIFAALEAKSKEVELPLQIVGVKCEIDVDSEDETRKFFLHVIASEIVVADIRTIDKRRLN